MKFHIIKTTISLIYYLLCLPKNACIQNIRVEYTEVLFTYCWYASANSAYINFILNYFFTFVTLNNFLFCTLNAIINYHIDCKSRFMKILLKSALETELSNCIVERPLYRPWKRSKLINAQLDLHLTTEHHESRSCVAGVQKDEDILSYLKTQPSLKMFKNTFQSGFLSILYSIGSKPLQIWDKKVSRSYHFAVIFHDRHSDMAT